MSASSGREIEESEGWVLMRLANDVGDPYLWEIQRDDEAGVFASDHEAVDFVRRKAEESRYHELSLRVHEVSRAYLDSKLKWQKKQQ
jgi:hypothetical protein